MHAALCRIMHVILIRDAKQLGGDDMQWPLVSF